MNRKVAMMITVGLLVPALAQGQASLASRPDKDKEAPAVAPGAPNATVESFSKHWTTAKDLALAVAAAMPAENYDFKPNPEEMSFGEQMMHIAQANYGYCAYASDAKSPFVPLVKDSKVDKAEASKQLAASFDYCTGVFAKVTDAQLDLMHGSGEHKVATRDLMMGVMIHMAHHRGQAEVYLRLKGIKPPDYKS